MITLDTNLTLYPGLYYYLPLIKSQNSNAYSSIDKYSDAQAAKGTSNTQNAQQTDQTNKTGSTNPAITDYNTLIEILKLNVPESKFAILKLIPRSELIQFLFLLNKDQLLSGIHLFTKDKILQFISNLPKEDLLKMLNKLFISPEHILDQMSIKDLNKFLSSKKIQKTDLIKMFQSLSRVDLAQIAEAATGVPQGNKTQAQLLQFINTELSTTQITDGLKGLEFKKMREMVSQMLKLDPSLYKEFSEEALFLQTVDFSKSSLIEGMGVLEPEKLISFMTELPNDFLALVTTQVDTTQLAQILVNDYQALLSVVMAG